MAKTPNEEYWERRKAAEIKGQYAQFLIDERREDNPDSAQLFAIRKIGGGFDYMGFRERDLIKLLAGRLTPYYD